MSKLSVSGFAQELCGKGGVLFLAQAILKLNAVPQFATSARVVAAVSRLKAKILSMVSLSYENLSLNILRTFILL